MKLSPKPKNNFQKKDWSDLDRLLQNNFKNDDVEVPSVTIKLSEYKMDENEIIEEATKQGYTVKKPSPGYLEFK